jgi:hypothetical protein
VVVAATPFKVSFVMRLMPLLLYCLMQTVTGMDRLPHLSDLNYYCRIALLQLAGVTANPVDGLTSHNS